MTVAATELFAPQFFFRKLLFISMTALNVSMKYILLSGCNALYAFRPLESIISLLLVSLI